MAGAAQPETYSLSLALAAPVEQLEAWLESAGPRHRVIYASGIEPPREAPAWRRARQWAGEGLVTLVAGRDEHDPRKTNWMMERCGVGVPGEADNLPARGRPGVRDHRTRKQAAQLLDLLRRVAAAGKPCPSGTHLVRALGLPRQPGSRRRVRHLFAVLAEDGAIALLPSAPGCPRVVRILAAGRGCGKVTGGENDG